MFTRLKAFGALAIAAAGRGLAFAVLLALFGLGAVGVVFILTESMRPAPRVAEDHRPLGGEPIRVLMGELELDIPRIGIVRVTPADGDTLDLFKGNDRSALAKLEEAAEGERIPIRGVGFTFYSAFGSRCRLPEQLQFLCEYGRPGEQPSLSTFSVGRFDQEHRDVVNQHRTREFEAASKNGSAEYSENFVLARQGDGGFVFRNTEDMDIIISCSYLLCSQSGQGSQIYNYWIRYRIDFEIPGQLENMASLHEKIITALAPPPSTNNDHERP